MFIDILRKMFSFDMIKGNCKQLTFILNKNRSVHIWLENVFELEVHLWSLNSIS